MHSNTLAKLNLGLINTLARMRIHWNTSAMPQLGLIYTSARVRMHLNTSTMLINTSVTVWIN